jgi:multidrug transporter EmrE-like cation transporter
VLSGTIAIVGAIQLQRTYTLLQQRESALTSLSEVMKDTAQSSKEFQRDNLALVHHLRFLKMIVFRLLQSPRLWNELSVQLKKSADLAEDILRESNLDDTDRITVAYALADYRYTTNRLAKTAFRTSLGFAASLTAPWLVLAGLCSFTAGVVCLVLYSQPVEVSATSFAVLGGTGFVLFAVLAVIIGVDPRPVALPFPSV